MKLPKHIKEKIKEVVRYEQLKRQTMQEITEWNPKLKEPVKALRDGWDWEMYFFGSPNEVSEERIGAVILTALTGKIHGVDYGLKTITLKELRKNESK